MTAHTITASRAVLGDRVLRGARWRTAILVGGGALLVAAAAQVRVPLWFTPVPITGQTFGVALVGAGLGARRGSLALLLYVLLGAIGLPVYAGGEAGFDHVLGSTGGYLVGFVFAAGLMGWLAERRADRTPWKAFLAIQAGSLVVFACGLTGLVLALDVTWSRAAELGWYPFIPGDLIKTAVAALLLPGAWRLADMGGRSEPE